MNAAYTITGSELTLPLAGEGLLPVYLRRRLPRPPGVLSP